MSILESEYILSPKATKAKRRRIKQALRAKKEAATSKRELSQIQANLVAPAHEHKSKDLDADQKQPKPRKPYIPPMNHA